MKKLFPFLAVFLLIPVISFPQLIEENFDYSITDSFSTVQSNWTTSSGTEAKVVSGSFSYTDYPSSGVGNKLQLSSSASSDYARSLPSSISSGSVYESFLLDVFNATGIKGNGTSGDYFIHYKSGNSNISRIYIREGTTGSVYQLGLGKTGSSTSSFLTSKELSYNTVYLVTFSYTFNTASTVDDEVELWVNPDLSGPEPIADLAFTDSTTDPVDIDKTCIRQSTTTINGEIDGIRVSTSWSTAPLPVELTAFNAIKLNDKVKLIWSTATEVNNYGFEIQRRKSSIDDWNYLGFVNGHGNSNTPHLYSFIVRNPKQGRNYFRLKQIDIDGQFEFSDIVEVNFNSRDYFILYPAYPNPCNPEAKENFYIKSSKNLTVLLYNELGEVVKSFFTNEYFESGLHSIVINGAGLPSGVYFLNFEGEGIHAVRKIVIAK